MPATDALDFRLRENGADWKGATARQRHSREGGNRGHVSTRDRHSARARPRRREPSRWRGPEHWHVPG
jgi:hypothetical protein